MKNAINQEIILIPGTSFLNKNWYGKSNPDNFQKLSHRERVKELCWSGMLADMLPEITETDDAKKQLTLWEVGESDSLIDRRLGEFNQSINDEWSINPFVFLVLTEMN